jgi:type IV pilus biogenesis protein CpaD/CtpE
MTTRNVISGVVVAAALAGCTTSGKTGMVEDQNLGGAKASTMAAQIVDPDPQYEYLDPATSGEHAAAAIDRYRKGAVKQPERVSSTSSTSAGPR